MSKVKITTWVDERTASAIKGLAAQQGVSVSELCAQKLKASVEEDGGAVGNRAGSSTLRTNVPVPGGLGRLRK